MCLSFGMIENDLFKALADPTRRAIFAKLAAGAMNASALREGMEISQPAMSQHLAVLRGARLVREQRAGRFVNYEVDPDGVALIASWLVKYRAYWPRRIDALKTLLKDAGSGEGLGPARSPQEPTGRSNARPMTSSATCGTTTPDVVSTDRAKRGPWSLIRATFCDHLRTWTTKGFGPMSDVSDQDLADQARADHLEFEYELDAPPEKVWRALSIAEFRDRWLPKAALANAEPVGSAPGEEIRYRMREDEPPFLESVVTFQLRPNADGGTHLKIIHRLAQPRVQHELPRAANNNGRCLMRAA